MKYSVIWIALLLSACDRTTMTNDEIIMETKKCLSAGMASIQYESPVAPGFTKVSCVPITKKSE